MITNQTAIINEFISMNAASGAQSHSDFPGMSLGVVIDTDDPLQMGRLKVFCPSYNDDPKQLQYIPWSIYASPFAGHIDNSSYARGNDNGPAESSGATHYGFWAIPEMGAHVIIGCIDGDFRRRFWFACVPKHQDNATIHVGRWKWNNGNVDGPLTGNDSPLEPQYTNLQTAFQGKTNSPEWKTRAAEYQTAAIRDDYGQTPNSKKNKTDQTNSKIIENEPQSWVHPTLGAHGYHWTGFKNIGAHLSSRTYGMSTPGFHTFIMDDRPFNSRLKFKTTNGHQIILDDSNERIYISTNNGKNYIEMDSNGNIDMFSDNRVSIHSKKDINLTSDEHIRMHAKKGIHGFAGEKQTQEPLESIPADGQIRWHACDDIHVITEKTYRHLSIENTLIEIGGKKCETIGDSSYLQVQNEINILTNSGDYNLTVSGNLNEFVQGDVRKYALGSMRNMSDGDAQMHSFTGKMDVGARKTINVKSIGEDIIIEAVGKNSGSGAGSGGSSKEGVVHLKSPESSYSVSNNGVETLTTKKIKTKSAEDIQYEIDDTITTVEPPENVTSPTECDIADTLSLDGFTGADLAARAAYNAGFRGDDLIVATAIAGAESSYNQAAINRADGRVTKWGPSVGMWQVRTLQQPQDWTGLDRNRDVNVVGGEDNLQNNANFAYEVYSRSGFREWGAYTNNSYRNYISQAENAVTSMCGGMSFTLSNESEFNKLFSLNLSSLTSNCANSILHSSGCSPDFSISANTSISMDINGLNLQSKIDTAVKSIAAGISTKIADGIVAAIDENATRLNELQAKTLSFMNIIGGAASGLSGYASMISAAADFIANFDAERALLESLGISFPFNIGLNIAEFVPDIPFDMLLGDICKFKVPEFEIDIKATFDIASHDNCENESEDDPGFIETDVVII